MIFRRILLLGSFWLLGTANGAADYRPPEDLARAVESLSRSVQV